MEQTLAAVGAPVEPTVMQHTPGPWRFTEGEYLYVNGTDAEGKRAFIIQRTLKGQKPSVQARIRADVRLIGAATVSNKMSHMVLDAYGGWKVFLEFREWYHNERPKVGADKTPNA